MLRTSSNGKCQEFEAFIEKKINNLVVIVKSLKSIEFVKSVIHKLENPSVLVKYPG